MDRNRIAFGAIFLEAFFVVLGVVLALAANEWREAHNENTRTRQAIASINDEILINQQSIVESVNYHIGITDSLQILVARQRSDGRRTLPNISLFSRGFIHPSEILTISYDLAAATDALGNMKYEDALAYARIYDKYDSYLAQQERVSAEIYTRMFDKGIQGILDNYENLATIIATFYFVECDILSSVNEYVPALISDGDHETISVPDRCNIFRGRRE